MEEEEDGGGNVAELDEAELAVRWRIAAQMQCLRDATRIVAKL